MTNVDSISVLNQRSTDTVTKRSGGWIASGLLIASLLPSAGCRICAVCEPNAYGAYGGAWERTVRDTGRVGSMFEPAGGLASNLVSRDDPEDPDELERRRQQERSGGVTDPDRTDGQDQEEADEAQDEELRDKAQELQERKLEDIEEEKEDELRKKNLDDINVRIMPGQPMPPVLR